MDISDLLKNSDLVQVVAGNQLWTGQHGFMRLIRVSFRFKGSLDTQQSFRLGHRTSSTISGIPDVVSAICCIGTIRDANKWMILHRFERNTTCLRSKKLKTLAHRIPQQLSAKSESGHWIDLQWVPEHLSVRGNITADRLVPLGHNNHDLTLMRHIYIVFVVTALSQASLYAELVVMQILTLWLVPSLRMWITFCCGAHETAQPETISLLYYAHPVALTQRCKTSLFLRVVYAPDICLSCFFSSFFVIKAPIVATFNCLSSVIMCAWRFFGFLQFNDSFSLFFCMNLSFI